MPFPGARKGRASQLGHGPMHFTSEESRGLLGQKKRSVALMVNKG